METIKVYVFPSHHTKERNSGVDFARVVQPMKHLDGYTDGDVTFNVKVFDVHKDLSASWFDIAKEYDVVFMNYSVLDWGFANLMVPLRAFKKKIIYDVDDAIWYIRRDNPTYDSFHKNGGWFLHVLRQSINEVDHVTTTSRYLKNILADKTLKHHDQITVIPNYIDLSLYSKTFEAQDRNPITILHFGSTTHYMDLLQKPFMEAMTKIMGEFPNVRFLTVGSFMPEYRYKFGPRYENAFGAIDIYDWIKKMPTFMEQADIVVAPLENDIYNRSKSFIKFLEYSSAKLPGVYQDINQYQDVVQHGVNGYLADSADSWYGYLKNLITDVKARKEVGEHAYKTVQKYQIKDHVQEYAAVIKKTLGI